MSPTATSEPLSALIVGCGEIAGGFDEDSLGPEVLTHAGAYSRHPRFTVAACVDPDPERRRNFIEQWGIGAGFADLDACRAAGAPYDVASVCVPTAAHREVLEGLLEMPVRAVFCEKPLTGDVAASRRLVEAYEKAGRPLAVNYFRRWDESMGRLRDDIAGGRWGAVQSVTGHYTKGVLNCGSHLIDLVAFLFGPLRAEAAFRSRLDFEPGDPTLDAMLSTEGGAPVYLVGADSRMFFTFEVDLMMEKGRLVIEDLGMVVRQRRVVVNPTFPSRRTLDRGEWLETGFGEAMLRAVDNLRANLEEGEALLGDGRDALAVQGLCAELLDMVAKGEAR